MVIRRFIATIGWYLFRVTWTISSGWVDSSSTEYHWFNKLTKEIRIEIHDLD